MALRDRLYNTREVQLEVLFAFGSVLLDYSSPAYGGPFLYRIVIVHLISHSLKHYEFFQKDTIFKVFRTTSTCTTKALGL
jgi:hypothetical protein